MAVWSVAKGSPLADADKPRPVPVGELAPKKRFDSPLFHRDGTLMLLAHAAVDEALVRALGSAGIDEVFACESPEAVHELRGASELAEVDIASFPEGVPVDRNLYDEAGELVASRGQPLSNAVLGDLARRGVARLYEERSPYEAVRERFEVALASAVVETLETRIEEDPSLLRVEPGAEAFADSCRRPTPAERTRGGIEEERRRHALSLAATHGLLERVRHEGMLDLPAAKDIVEELLGRFERDLPLSLALAETALHNNYLVDHSFAVAAHAGACGLALGYDRSQCAELTLGGLLHDIGMARVSEDVIKKEGPLSPEELAEIREHPRAGLELVKSAPGVSMPLPFAVFQDHERTDGRGYPLGLSNGWIHDHAKLIAVADCYQAMTAPRPYKPRRAPHRAVLQILRMVQEEALDPLAAKAFLRSHGLYPVASWVRLSDGRAARVIDSAADQFDRPVVTALGDAVGRELAQPEVIDLTSEAAEDIKVDDPLETARVRFDFAAGFHLEGPREPAHVPLETAPPRPSPPDEMSLRRDPPVASMPPSGPAGSGRQARKVPSEYLDWSAGFSGFLSDFSAVDLIQILDVSQKSGVLALRFPGAMGQVKVSEGDILSAELTTASGDTMRDEEAIYRMVDFTEGSFRFEQTAVERRKTVRANNATILIEACRLQDERRRGKPKAEE